MLTPQLAFSGRSLPSASVDDRILTNLSGAFSLTGICEALLGDVSIKSSALRPLQLYTTPCSAEGTFSLTINTDGVTAPYFAVGDPLIQIKQGSHSPVMTRIMYISSYPLVKIYNAADLQNMTVGNYAASKAYVLMNDIDLSAVNYTPVGSGAMNFWRGLFFGEGHTISHLWINSGGQDYKGLFGSAKDGFIQDLHLENATVVGYLYVGALVGRAVGVTMSRVSVTGSVSGFGVAGMIAGYSMDSDIKYSWASGVATSLGSEVIGGLIGHSEGGDIVNSWSDVNVISSANVVGGLIGSMDEGSTDAVLENSFSMGSITGLEGAGGLVGSIWEYNLNSNTPILKNSFTLANIVVSNSNPTGYASGSAIGHAGSLLVSPYVADPGIQISGLYHLSGATCTYCNPAAVAHSSAANLSTILNWSKATWDYTWTWKTHSSGARPDLLVNPKN
ncbi:MAG: hypothetical protein JNL11_04235 [Bdellovibrionaceae bacterium]|nr:hypothetical protein [Pseudobdellovibrionaceae bacterium]